MSFSHNAANSSFSMERRQAVAMGGELTVRTSSPSRLARRRKTETDDARLIGRLKDSDHDALETIFKIYSGKLYIDIGW